MKFRTKTIIGIALIETVLLVILVISSIGFLNRSNDEQIKIRASTTAALFASTTKDAVLSTDLDSLQTYVDELISNLDIVYVRIIGSGTVLAQGGDEQLLQSPFVPDSSLRNIDDDVYDAFAIIEESGYEFGRIELGLSVAATTRLISEAWRWAAGIATIEIVLVAFFSFVLGTYLTRQLLQLTRASETISVEGPGYQIEYQGDDEIGKVSRSFNQMSKNLAESYERLHASTDEYRELAERLTNSDAKKSSMLASALDGIITIDSAGVIEEFNVAAEVIFGYSANEVLGKPLQSLIIPEEYREAHRRGMEHWHTTGEGPILGKRFEITAQRKNGEILPIELAITPVTVNHATIFTGFIRDISSQKNAEQELRIAASAFDAQEGIFITDKDSRIIRANTAFSAITGYTRDEALGSTPAALFKSNRHGEVFYEHMWDALINHGRWEGEIFNRRKNGEIYPVWLGISAIRDEDNEVVNYIAHFIDISERKRFEEELVESRQKAEAANIAKSQFLATMSHEIRTPLYGVIGMIDLLLESELQPKQKHMLRTANNSAQILLDIIKNILDFSKIESGEMSLEALQVDIIEIVEETCNILTPVARQKCVRLILLIDPKINYRVVSDPVRLHQILFNLISNAIKFTQSDSINEERVIIRIEPSDNWFKKDTAPIRITVTDNGIGIKRETLQSIFEPFEQAETSTTRRFGGSGLGLAITKRIVDAMDGSIEVESIYGTGTKFIVELPLKAASESYDIEQSLDDTRILVIEPLSPLDKYLSEYFRQHGAQTTLIDDLEKARQTAVQAHRDQTDYDVVVVGAGWEQVRQISWATTLQRELPTARVQFVLLTNMDNRPDQAVHGVRYVNAFPLLLSNLLSETIAAAQRQPVSDSQYTKGPVERTAAGPAVSYPHVRVLLVEDNEVNQIVINLQLMELGYRADIASDGVQALEMFCNQNYDLVITDCHMPRMDGPELLYKIRHKEGAKSKVPIIVISADSQDLEQHKLSEDGMNEYLVKPIRMDELGAAISKHINNKAVVNGANSVYIDQIDRGNRNTGDVTFDDDALKTLLGGTPLAVRNKLLDKFLHTAKASMDLFNESMQRLDTVTIRREAHKLKSSAKAIGALKISRICSSLEAACLENNTKGINDQLNDFQKNFAAVSEDINRAIQKNEQAAE